jgi:hypothetical protein
VFAGSILETYGRFVPLIPESYAEGFTVER